MINISMVDSLSFPTLSSVDHARLCPLYTNVLNRNDETVTVDDIDSLQMDFETLLAAATKRMRLLQTELQILDDSNNKKENKRDADHKRSKNQAEKGSKKMKFSDSPKYSFASGSSNSNTKERSKAKGAAVLQSRNLQEYEMEDSEENQPARVPINDAPSRFWQSVEPYCAPIQPSHVKMLEEMIASSDNVDDYTKIPELGVHFSERWATEDMKEEQGEGNRANFKNFEKLGSQAEAVLKKASDSLTHDSCPFGSLTQRLISSFVEQNIMAPPDEALQVKSKSEKNDRPRLLKPVTIQHTNKLESRIKMELIEQGILEPDSVESNQEDEILSELTRCQRELSVLRGRNKDVLQQLLDVAKGELAKQEVRKKMESANVEVMDNYRRVMAARQKKRSLSKKEKDAAWKSLKDREALSKQLS